MIRKTHSLILGLMAIAVGMLVLALIVVFFKVFAWLILVLLVGAIAWQIGDAIKEVEWERQYDCYTEYEPLRRKR